MSCCDKDRDLYVVYDSISLEVIGFFRSHKEMMEEIWSKVRAEIIEATGADEHLVIPGIASSTEGTFSILFPNLGDIDFNHEDHAWNYEDYRIKIYTLPVTGDNAAAFSFNE